MKRDKIYHLIAGIIIALVAVLVLKYRNINIIWGILPVIAIGGVKEIIWDKWMKRGCPEWMDFIWTCIGGLIIILIFMLW